MQSIAVKSFVKKVIVLVDLQVSRLLCRNKYLASFYYFLLSSKFRREHHSVLLARVKYYGDGKSSIALLRRNVHRLEKGLSMKPRRDMFAQDFIEETVKAFGQCKVDNLNNNSLVWFKDVMSDYFSTTEMSAKNQHLPNIFFTSKLYCELNETASNDVKKSPFLYGERNTNVGYDELLSLVHARHSVRWYIDKKVTNEDIDACVKVASKAPSACNRQPFRYVFLDGDMASKVSSFAMGTGGFSQNIKHLAVVVGDLSAYPYERDRHVIYIDGSLSSMLLMLAFKSKGIDSCPINWPDIEIRENKLEKELSLKKHERAIMFIAFGYADSDAIIPFSEKKSINELREYY